MEIIESSMRTINFVNSSSSHKNKLNTYHKVAIAPMLDVTTNHYRQMMRLITRETVLYTEMIHHDTILYSKKGADYELKIDEIENPIVIQLGGNKPDILEKIAGLCKTYNYDEVNLNCGCPSSKVQNSNFGACMMRNPDLTAECTKRIREASNLEVSVKCRLGLDHFDAEFLNEFISKVSTKGSVKHFIVHARLALMNLDTDKNRKIPPLQYERITDLMENYKELDFTLNGGVKTLDEVENLMRTYQGVMIGRAAYDNPWIFADVDRRFYGKTNQALNRKEIVYKYSDYCDIINMEDPECHYNYLIKPLTNLFSNEKKNSHFKNLLYSYKANKEILLSDHLKTVIDEYEKINFEAVNELPISN